MRTRAHAAASGRCIASTPRPTSKASCRPTSTATATRISLMNHFRKYGGVEGEGSVARVEAIAWLESIDKEPWLVEHVIAPEADDHGVGRGRHQRRRPPGRGHQARLVRGPAQAGQRHVAFPQRLRDPVPGLAPHPGHRRQRRRAERHHRGQRPRLRPGLVRAAGRRARASARSSGTRSRSTTASSTP